MKERLKMKGKITSFMMVGALTASFITQAQYEYNEPCAYQGFYAGVWGGVANTFGHLLNDSGTTMIEPSISGNIPFDTFSVGQKIKVSQNRFAAGLSLGYSHVFCTSFYLGGELGINYSPGRIEANFSQSTANAASFLTPGNFLFEDAAGSNAATVLANATMTLNETIRTSLRKWEWTADLTPGFVLCDNFLIFGRVGVAFNETRLNTCTTLDNFNNGNGNFVVVGTNSPGIETLSLSERKNRGGLRLGIGLSNYICEDLVLTANYVYTNYGKVSVFGLENITNSPVNPAFNQIAAQASAAAAVPGQAIATVNSFFLRGDTKVKLQRQFITLGLNYYFGF